jgi:hypothetical protein
VNLNRLFVIGAIGVVALGLAVAFVFLGTPSHQRLVSLDNHRIRELTEIAQRLHNRYPSGKLPRRAPSDLSLHDPATAQSYSFHRVDSTHYVLCAVFDTDDTTNIGEQAAEEAMQAIMIPPSDWRHPAGRVCYEFEVTQGTPTPRRV